jgi:hypothetical protein
MIIGLGMGYTVIILIILLGRILYRGIAHPDPA